MKISSKDRIIELLALTLCVLILLAFFLKVLFF